MRNSNGVDVYTGLEVGTDIVLRGMKGGKLEKGQPIVLDKIRILNPLNDKGPQRALLQC
jgi:hypothetical protein